MVSFATVAAQSSAIAEDCAAPCAGYAVSLELQNDWTFAARPSHLRSDIFAPTLDTTIFVSPVEHLKLVGTITAEDVADETPGETRIFEGLGVYASELYAEITTFAPVTLQFGKFDPVFGLATDQLDGIRATDLVGDYDAEERWAAEATLSLKSGALAHTLTASLFTTDRSFLSESLFTARDPVSLSDGGAGNTEGVSSAAILLDGCKGAETPDCYADGEFGYRFGLRYQKAGRATEDQAEDGVAPRDEIGYLAAATARIEIDEAVLRLLGEAVYFQGFDGDRDDAVFATMSAALECGPVTYMAAYTRQDTLIDGEPDTASQLVDLTATYEWDEDAGIAGERWSLGAGYNYARNEEGEDAHALSILLKIDLEHPQDEDEKD